MFIEKKWLRVPPKAFTANGTPTGVITVPSVAGFYVKQFVTIKGNTLQTVRLQIKRILSDTEIAVGPAGGKITDRSNMSGYTVALSSTVEADEQDRNDISLADRERAVYAEEPIVAVRTVLVDDTGDYYSDPNPLPVKIVDGNITIENANIDVNLSDKESSLGANDYDITRIGDGTSQLDINLDGSINVKAPEVETLLESIDNGIDQLNTTFSNPIEIAEPVRIAGTEDGSPSGTEFTFVNNIRLQVLASKDRQQNFTYADFGTKNQRITQVDYTSLTFSGTTVSKVISYTLIGNRYRRDSIDWIVT